MTEQHAPSGETAERPPEDDLPVQFQDVIKITKLGGLLSRPFFQTFATEHDLTLNEWRALVLIVRRPGVSSQEIAAFTGLHAMNVSRAVAGLRDKGRVESTQDPTNHRRQLLSATRAGQQLFDELFPSARERADRLFEVLDADERRVFSELLDRVTTRADEALGDESD